MEPEQLQILLKALEGIGQNGKEAFIWWVVCRYGLEAIGVFGLLGVGYACVVKIVNALERSSYKEIVFEGIVRDCGFKFSFPLSIEEARQVRDHIKALQIVRGGPHE